MSSLLETTERPQIKELIEQIDDFLDRNKNTKHQKEFVKTTKAANSINHAKPFANGLL